MRILNILIILSVTAALSGYSAWVLWDLKPRSKPVASEFVEAPDISLWRLDDVEALWHEPSTLFVDVRSSIDFDFGHISGAVSLPYEEFDQRFAGLRPRLERADTIVVYCKNRDCGKSLWAAIRLRRVGLKQTTIYPEGWNEWYLHGLPHTGTER